MASISLADQLQVAIEIMVADPDSAPSKVDLKIGELLGIAAELRLLPAPSFRAALRAELLGETLPATVLRTSIGTYGNDPDYSPRSENVEEILPTLFGNGSGTYPMQRGNFALSLAMHAAAIVIVATAGMWVARQTPLATRTTTTLLAEVNSYPLPSSRDESHGGGGGGDQDKLKASKGNLPRFAMQQITPPTVIVRNESPKLSAEATVVGPPALTMPSTSQVGDPLSAVLQASNGTGSGGGIGSGSVGGIGAGSGPGVGPGWGGGIGDGVFRVGGGVSAPRAIYDPDPQYSDEARRAKYQGTVVLWVVVGANGKPRDVRVSRSLGMGLDEKAIEAVREWRFEPAIKDGRPVAVQVNIEVDFRLY